MAAVTLLEASKLMEPSRKAGVVQIYADAYQPLSSATVINTGGKASYAWRVEDDLAHTSGGKRNVGSDFTATYGNAKPYESDVKIYGGKIQVDEYIMDHSPASMNFQEASQIRSHAREFTVDLFEGTGGTSLRGFRDWMQNDTAYAGQETWAGSTANGDVLTEAMIDELISDVNVVQGQSFFYCADIVARRMKYIAKGQVSNQSRVNYTSDEWGKWNFTYDGIPVVVLRDGKNSDLLSTTEYDYGTANQTTCSLYLVTWGQDMASLFSSSAIVAPNGVPLPKMTKENDGSNFKYERLTWYVGLAPHQPRCMGRIKGVKNSIS